MISERIILLGATGRLGRALQTRLRGHQLIGLARRPQRVEPSMTLEIGDRRDTALLARLIDRADLVVDLCGFDALDALALLDATQLANRTELPLIACSSLAERPWSQWNQPETAASPLPEDSYGRNKRLYSQALIDHWRGPCLALLLPNLLETSPVDPRLQQWWQQTRASGVATVPGDGSQKTALLTSDLTADLIALLGGHPTPLRGRLALAVPQPPAVLHLAQALFAAMDPPPLLKPGGPQGIFSAGPEPVHLQRQAELLPDYPWPDLLDLMRQLGQRLAIGAID